MLNKISSALLLSVTLTLFTPSVFTQTMEPFDESEHLAELARVTAKWPKCKIAGMEEIGEVLNKILGYVGLGKPELLFEESKKSIDLWEAEIERQKLIFVKGTLDFDGPAHQFAIEQLAKAYAERQEKLHKLIERYHQLLKAPRPVSQCSIRHD